jgi:hypothetical protein
LVGAPSGTASQRAPSSGSLKRGSRVEPDAPTRRGRGTALKILLSDAALIDDLIGYLAAEGCVVEQVGPNLVEASRLSSVRHDQARLELDLYLHAWKLAHPEADVRLLD